MTALHYSITASWY